MNAIELMIEEHTYVSRMLVVMRKMCMRVLDNKDIDYDDFYLVIDFIRNFADGHHHNKEEIFLFNKMVQHLGKLGEKVITNGMLVEHDLGRLYVSNLEQALQDLKDSKEEAKLDIIGSCISYTNLLTSHIDKENNVVFSFANRQLDRQILKDIDKEFKTYENDNEETRSKYISLLIDLETTYLK